MADDTTVLDAKRNRELFRYMLPEDLLVKDGTPLCEDDSLQQNISSALHPYCQLTAFRCGAPKAMVNVMDLDKMYFLSQASAGVDGVEIEDDPVLQACSGAVPLAGRVCEMTIRMAADVDWPPIFAVPDLADSVFENLSVVSGPPFYRFYAGTPITTKAGVHIGSLAVLDTKPRQGLTSGQEAFLGHTSRQIMNLLEVRRYATEGKRAVRLGRSMEAFLSGQTTIFPVKTASTSYGIPVRARPSQRTLSVVNEQIGMSQKDNGSDDTIPSERNKQQDLTEQSVPQTFARAADLLREAFADMGDEIEVNFVSLSNVDLSRRSAELPPFNAPGMDGSPRRPVYRHTTFVATSPRQPDPDTGLPRELVASLVQRYPSGCLFDFQDRTCLSPLDEHGKQDSWLGLNSDRPRTSGELARFKALEGSFPHARQLLFAPLWDPDRASFAFAAFIVSSGETASLSTSTDLSFLNAFCCSLMAECSRINAAKSQKQKEDFVGTMSHEMRSPLHGILAGVEFLAETSLDTYQRSLASTVQTCGRTLLDTIDHVLDFSKINTYQKSRQATNQRTKGLQKTLRRPGATPPAMLQMTDVVQVAAVVEEVVDTLIIGRQFSSVVDADDFDSNLEPRNGAKRGAVKILLDIQNADWTFLTQQGAIRRIIINLTGNALKYTLEGSVTIRLELRTTNEENLMTLTVTDTGCGISESFIGNRLFTPFSQENTLAPGTGLGLSIVHNIVAMMNGSITVQSEVGKGASFRVVLPLQRPVPGQQSAMTTLNSGSTNSSGRSDPQSSIDHVLSQTTHRRVTLAISDSDLGMTVRRLVAQWFKLEVVSKDADIYIADEDRALCTYPASSIVLLLGTLSQQRKWQGINTRAEFILIPVGPYRFARSICAALSRYNAAPRSSTGSVDLQTTPEDMHTERIHDQVPEIELGSHNRGNLSRSVLGIESVSIALDDAEAQNVLHSPPDVRIASRSDDPEYFSFNLQQGVGSSPAPSVAEPKLSSPADVLAASPPRYGNIYRSLDHKPRVLVVDDNRINLTLLRSFLRRKRDYTIVDTAEDGQQAIDTFTRNGNAYDIVFMDISMPIMNGFEATRAIRSFEANRPASTGGALIVALTGLAGARDQAEAFDAGIDIYMTKPVSFKLVIELLDNWESNKKLERPSHEQLAKEFRGPAVIPVRSEGAIGTMASPKRSQ